MFSSVCLRFVQVEFVIIKVPRGETCYQLERQTSTCLVRLVFIVDLDGCKTKQEHVESLNFVNDTVFITVMFVSVL